MNVPQSNLAIGAIAALAAMGKLSSESVDDLVDLLNRKNPPPTYDPKRSSFAQKLISEASERKKKGSA